MGSTSDVFKIVVDGLPIMHTETSHVLVCGAQITIKAPYTLATCPVPAPADETSPRRHEVEVASLLTPCLWLFNRPVTIVQVPRPEWFDRRRDHVLKQALPASKAGREIAAISQKMLEGEKR